MQMGAANPASIRLQEQLGAGTYNVPTDFSLAMLAAARAAVDLPIDFYVEVPDGFGGFIRHYEIGEIVRVAAPVYLKFGLRNAPDRLPERHSPGTDGDRAQPRARAPGGDWPGPPGALLSGGDHVRDRGAGSGGSRRPTTETRSNHIWSRAISASIAK